MIVRSAHFLFRFHRQTLTPLASLTGFRSMSDHVHGTAKAGFVDGENYDRFRPSYTDEVVKIIASIITDSQTGKGNNLQYDCVELGAGTGKLTKKLLNELSQVNKTRYLATDPMEGFLGTLKRNCLQLLDTKVCSADNIPLPSESIQTVIAAQCFHWFANTASITEINRILTPPGKFIMVWNNKDWKVPWIKDMEEILTHYYGDTPRAVSYQWKTAIENFSQFRCVRHSILPGTQLQGRGEDVIGHFSSISVIASLEKEEKETVQREMKTVLDKHGLVSDTEDIVIPFHTELYVAEKVNCC